MTRIRQPFAYVQLLNWTCGAEMVLSSETLPLYMEIIDVPQASYCEAETVHAQPLKSFAYILSFQVPDDLGYCTMRRRAPHLNLSKFGSY